MIIHTCGRPDIVDAIGNREIQLAVNTPAGRSSQEDDSYIRKTAIRFKVPCNTTTAASIATAKEVAARKAGEPVTKSLQVYHGEVP